MESSSVVGVVARCKDECLVVIRPLLNGFRCQELSQAFVEASEVVASFKGFKQWFEEWCVCRLLVERKRQSFQAVCHERDMRAGVFDGEELQPLLVIVGRQEVGRVGVL